MYIYIYIQMERAREREREREKEREEECMNAATNQFSVQDMPGCVSGPMRVKKAQTEDIYRNLLVCPKVGD